MSTTSRYTRSRKQGKKFALRTKQNIEALNRAKQTTETK